ncbi:MAG: DUF2380 domain-containing protein [Fibrobacteria bacterium]|nr:DUF2380 domain-containing protein [Fibrobacteria bacterium]
MNKFLFIKLCFLLVLFSAYLFAQKEFSLAVYDLKTDGIDSSKVRTITDKLRAELVKTGAFRVMERGEMEAIFAEQKFQASGICDKDDKLVEMGRLLGVEKIVTGSVGEFNKNFFVMNVKMIDVETGEIVKEESEIRRTIQYLLIRSTRYIAKDFAKFENPLKEQSAQVKK